MTTENIVLKIEGFEWDRWNTQKNIRKHNVYPEECEEAFFNRAITGEISPEKSKGEQRYYLLGITGAERLLTVVFTIRKERIRVVSVRNMSRKERRFYEEKIKERAGI